MQWVKRNWLLILAIGLNAWQTIEVLRANPRGADARGSKS